MICYMFDVCSGVEEHLPSKRHKNNVGIVSNSDRIRNKRVQTTVAMVGETKSQLLGDDMSGKVEIIQKDIGYSSDADMSDAVEVNKQLSYQQFYINTHF